MPDVVMRLLMGTKYADMSRWVLPLSIVDNSAPHFLSA
jgi:hypothetical protein